jgi:hypothetical protein
LRRRATHRFVFDTPSSGAAEEANLIAGTDQLAVSAAIVPLLLDASNHPQTVIFQGGTGPGIVFVGAQRYQSSIGSNLAGYANKTWCATNAVGGAPLGEAAKAVGLQWPPASFASVGSVAAFLSTMQSGQCDITTMDSGSAARAEIDGLGYVVQNPNVPATQKKDFGGVESYNLAFGNQQTVRQYPVLMQKIADALVATLRFIQTNSNNPSKIYKESPAIFKAANPIDLVTQALTLADPSFMSANGFVVPSQLLAAQHAAVASGVSSTSVPDSQLKALINDKLIT